MINMSDSEREIMQIIWKNDGKILFAQLIEALKLTPKKWSDKTVSTFLSRLVEKGMLGVRKQGRINCYTATVSEADYLKMVTDSFVGKEYGGKAMGLLQHLIDEYVSEDDLRELEILWKEAKKR